ncbi:hypothetical protein NMY22_g20012 [Coprinellus aureogranulatus]|nr:hypothetical protein NMY22_g20012 [Coprinellus aureogranulatus]
MVLGPLKGHRSGVKSICFTPDGHKLVSGSWDKTVRVWDTQTGDMILGPLKEHTEVVRSVSCSPNGTVIASGSSDKTVRVRDAQTGETVLHPLMGHTGWVNSVHFSPDGKRVVSGSEDKTIRIWNVERAQPAFSRLVFLHDYSAADLVVDNDDGWVRNRSGDLLLWIPPQFRPSVCTPSLERIIGGPQTRIELTHALHHGSDWRRRVFVPRSSGLHLIYIVLGASSPDRTYH